MTKDKLEAIIEACDRPTPVSRLLDPATVKEMATLALRAVSEGGVEPADYLVWSNQHRAWWRQNSCGYARSILEAGRYTRTEAVDIADKSRNGWKLDQRPDEIAVAIADLPAPIRAALTAAEGK